MIYFSEDMMESRQLSREPISTGTSVLGVTYDGGVMIATDQLASYGSLARFRLNVSRVARVNDNVMIGCGGDYADYQHMLAAIEQKVIEEESVSDDHHLTPNALFSWITRIQYNRRSKFDPLWCNWIVGGRDHNGKPFLGFIDKLGTAYESPLIANGFGGYIALPLMREEFDKKGGKLSEDDARKLLEKCLTVLYYRDARSASKYHLGVVNSNGCAIDGPFEVKSNWDIADYVVGYE